MKGMGSFGVSRLQPILHRVLDWLPAALSVLMIALESTATMSSDNTSRWLYPLWIHLFGPISPARWEVVHHLIRKTGHFVGYGAVSLAFFYGWRQTLHRMSVKHWTLWRRASVLAVLCTVVVASLDEYHQSFLPSRTSSPLDVGIDLCGAIAFQLVLLLIIQWFSRRPRYRAA
jgi:VanZ family protein